MAPASVGRALEAVSWKARFEDVRTFSAVERTAMAANPLALTVAHSAMILGPSQRSPTSLRAVH